MVTFLIINPEPHRAIGQRSGETGIQLLTLQRATAASHVRSLGINHGMQLGIEPKHLVGANLMILNLACS